jgi:hypothetical protein
MNEQGSALVYSFYHIARVFSASLPIIFLSLSLPLLSLSRIFSFSVSVCFYFLAIFYCLNNSKLQLIIVVKFHVRINKPNRYLMVTVSYTSLIIIISQID